MAYQKKLEHNFSIGFKRFLERSMLIKYDESLDSLFDLSNKLFFIPTGPDTFEQFFLKNKDHLQETANLYQHYLENSEFVGVTDDANNDINAEENQAIDIQNQMRIASQHFSSDLSSETSGTEVSDKSSRPSQLNNGLPSVEIGAEKDINQMKSHLRKSIQSNSLLEQGPLSKYSSKKLIKLKSSSSQNQGKNMTPKANVSMSKRLDSEIINDQNHQLKKRGNSTQEVLKNLLLPSNNEMMAEVNQQYLQSQTDMEFLRIRGNDTQELLISHAKDFNQLNTNPDINESQVINMAEETNKPKSTNSIVTDDPAVPQKSRSEIRSRNEIDSVYKQVPDADSDPRYHGVYPKQQSKEMIRQEVLIKNLDLETINEDIIAEKDSVNQGDFQMNTQSINQTQMSNRNFEQSVEPGENQLADIHQSKERLDSHTEQNEARNELLKDGDRIPQISSVKSQNLVKDGSQKVVKEIQVEPNDQPRINSDANIEQNMVSMANIQINPVVLAPQSNVLDHQIPPNGSHPSIPIQSMLNGQLQQLAKDINLLPVNTKQPNFGYNLQTAMSFKSLNQNRLSVNMGSKPQLYSLQDQNRNYTGNKTSKNQKLKNVKFRKSSSAVCLEINLEKPKEPTQDTVSMANSLNLNDWNVRRITKQRSKTVTILDFSPDALMKEPFTQNYKMLSEPLIKINNEHYVLNQEGNSLLRPTENSPLSVECKNLNLVDNMMPTVVDKNQPQLSSFQKMSNSKNTIDGLCAQSQPKQTDQSVANDQNSANDQVNSHYNNQLMSRVNRSDNINRIVHPSIINSKIIDDFRHNDYRNHRYASVQIQKEPLNLIFPEAQHHKSTMSVPSKDECLLYRGKSYNMHMQKLPQGSSSGFRYFPLISPEDLSSTITIKTPMNSDPTEVLLKPADDNKTYPYINKSSLASELRRKTVENINKFLFGELKESPAKNNADIDLLVYQKFLDKGANSNSLTEDRFKTPKSISKKSRLGSMPNKGQVLTSNMSPFADKSPEKNIIVVPEPSEPELVVDAPCKPIMLQDFDSVKPVEQQPLQPQLDPKPQVDDQKGSFSSQQIETVTPKVEEINKNQTSNFSPEKRSKIKKEVIQVQTSQKQKATVDVFHMKVSKPLKPEDQNSRIEQEEYGLKIQQMASINRDYKSPPRETSNQTANLDLSAIKQSQKKPESRPIKKHTPDKEIKRQPVQANYMTNKVEEAQSKQLKTLNDDNNSEHEPKINSRSTDREAVVPDSPIRQQRLNNSEIDQSSGNSNRFNNDRDLAKTVKKGSRRNTSNSKLVSEGSQKLILDLRINDQMQPDAQIGSSLNQNIYQSRDSEGRQSSKSKQPLSHSKSQKSQPQQQNFVQRNQPTNVLSPKTKGHKQLTANRLALSRSSRPNSKMNNLPAIKQEPSNNIFVNSQDNDKINLNINITVVIQNQTANQQATNNNQPMGISDLDSISKNDSTLPQSNRVSGRKPAHVINNQKVLAQPPQMTFTRNEFWKRKVSKPEVPRFKHRSLLKEENSVSFSKPQKITGATQTQIESMKSTVTDALFKAKKLPQAIFSYQAEKERDKENLIKTKTQILPKISAPHAITSQLPPVHPSQPAKKEPTYVPVKDLPIKIPKNETMMQSQIDPEHCYHHRPCQSVDKGSEVPKSSKLKLKNELEQLRLSKPANTNSPYDLNNSNKVLRKNFNVEIKILDSPEPQISSNVYNLRYKVCKTNFFMDTNHRN